MYRGRIFGGMFSLFDTDLECDRQTDGQTANRQTVVTYTALCNSVAR